MEFNYSFVAPQLAAESVGPANQLFANLIQTILTVQMSISAPNMWPSDYGQIASEKGKYSFTNFE